MKKDEGQPDGDKKRKRDEDEPVNILSDTNQNLCRCGKQSDDFFVISTFISLCLFFDNFAKCSVFVVNVALVLVNCSFQTVMFVLRNRVYLLKELMP